MPPEEILLVNPNTGTTPVFRSRRDAEITIGIYKRIPVLWRYDPEENPWGLSFMAMFHMANDSRLFRAEEDLLGDGWKLDGNVFVKGDPGDCMYIVQSGTIDMIAGELGLPLDEALIDVALDLSGRPYLAYEVSPAPEPLVTPAGTLNACSCVS